MKLLFKQRFFSWFDSYDIYNELGETVYTVKGKLAWGHCLKIYDAEGREVGTVKERVLSWLPKFEIYFGNEYIGNINKEFTFFKPKFNIDYNGWWVDGDWFEWDYSIYNSLDKNIANVSKELWKLTDTYVIDVFNPQDALFVLMLVLAIDAEKCSRSN
ncbi:MAG: LURP-one-related family protein [Clostridia bacterium]|nr:LURP-one-related family protein [Clostridia bacterium]